MDTTHVVCFPPAYCNSVFFPPRFRVTIHYGRIRVITFVLFMLKKKKEKNTPARRKNEFQFFQLLNVLDHFYRPVFICVNSTVFVHNLIIRPVFAQHSYHSLRCNIFFSLISSSFDFEFRYISIINIPFHDKNKITYVCR